MYSTVLDIARYGSLNGIVEFPLSPVHYLELPDRTDPKRAHVSTLMYELSRCLTMIGPNQYLLLAEVEQTLKQFVGKPEAPAEVEVFGYGYEHTQGVDLLHGFLCSEDEWRRRGRPEASRPRSDREAFELIQRSFLDGTLGFETTNYTKSAFERHSQGFAQSEAAMSERLQKLVGRHRWPDGLLLREFQDLIPVLIPALAHAGLSLDGFVDEGPEFVRAFIEAVPTVAACLKLRQLQHANPQRAWESNDNADVHALAMAAVYCDVVVAEGHWAHMMRRGGLDARHGTVVLDSISDLAVQLVGTK